jgi:hypothetical protein
MSLTPRIVAASEVDAGLRARLFAIYAAHYDAVEVRRFAADLAAKDYVILLEQDGEPMGFSTVAYFDFFPASGGPVKVLFSGDTVIDRSAWGEQGLSRSFAQLAGALHARAPQMPLYWLLISKGHRTYRYLHLFARRYFPSAEGEQDALARLAREIASQRFGADYDPAKGVIDFGASRGHLKDALADIPPHVAGRPEAAYFLRRNPGYRAGHELVCLAPLAPDNLRSVVRQSFLQGMAHGLG